MPSWSSSSKLGARGVPKVGWTSTEVGAPSYKLVGVLDRRCVGG